MKKTLRSLCFVMAFLFAMTLFNIRTFAESNVEAHWVFDEENIISGSIEDGNMIIKDLTNKGNNLKMNIYSNGQLTTEKTAGQWDKYLYFVNEGSSNSSNKASLVFNGDNKNGLGADLITVDNAPINKEEFRDGYTIEFVYKFPIDWTRADSWMGLMARQIKDPSTVKSMDEPQLGSTSIAVSSVKEIQFLTANADDSNEMPSAWSLSMDKGGVWYHIVITSDENGIKTYLNGGDSFRNFQSTEMNGLYADPEDGRFRIGSSYWLEGDQTLDKFLKGSLEEVRISKGVLDKSQWLVTEPEKFAGDYGYNDDYKLKNPNNYNFVFIPDTQNTVKFEPEVMTKAIDGLTSQKDKDNIVGVVHLGDIVEDFYSPEQNQRAQEIFKKLPQSGIKTMLQPGNHDDRENFSNYYGKDSDIYNYAKDYLTYTSPSGRSSYMKVKAGSYEYLLIALSYYDFMEDLEWMENILKENPLLPTIITSHNLLDVSDTVPNETSLSYIGEEIWPVAKKYNQVFMLFAGHNHGAGYSVLKNDAGNDVYAVLADYQFAYKGGGGFFKYAEFSEEADKIYLKTYSPYSATIPASEKTFFDVNFLAGPGNDDVLDLDFKDRFSGMDLETRDQARKDSWKLNINAPYTKGWLAGEFHNHTNSSNDASEPYMLLENTLNAAFRENLESLLKEGDPSLDHGQAFDFLMSADHLRTSPRNVNGQDEVGPTWKVIEGQIQKFNELRAKGKYSGKIYYPGFEWDMFMLDHGATAIITDGVNVPVDGIQEFEWLYSYDTKTEAFNDQEEEKFGPRKNEKNNIQRSYEAVSWLRDRYPNSMVSLNHPSRHNGGSGQVTIDQIRKLNDLAPNIVFSFEGLPGNQMGGDRGEMEDIYGGADVILAEVGGIWDALLGEGRKFYTIGNSDFHFKVSSNRLYSSGYWPSEYVKNYIYTEGDNFLDLANGLRAGRAFTVHGDLISALNFTAENSNNKVVMGGDLVTEKGDYIDLKISFKESDFNNYKEITAHKTEVNNKVKLDHIDLIGGLVTGKATDYNNAKNPSTKVIARFYRDDWGPADSQGYYTISYKVKADKDMYFRLRGTNLPLNTQGETDENGNPLKDIRLYKEDFPSLEDYFNAVNDRNYSDLWFYSNPIFVTTKAKVDKEEPVEEDKEEPKEADYINNLISSGLIFAPEKPRSTKTQNQETFLDYKNHWAQDVIAYVIQKGYMDLDNKGNFNPDSYTSRFEVVKALALIEKVDPKTYMGKSLVDIDQNSEASGYINWAIEKGIIHGYEDGSFKGSREISREEMAKILNKYVENLKKDRPVLEEIIFGDQDQIADWAKEDVKKATERGLMKGTDQGKFEPKGKLTRAQVAQIIYNIEK